MWTRTNEASSIAAGCLAAMTSAVITALMLFVNGAFVMAIVTAVSDVIPNYLVSSGGKQFVIFTVSVALTVVEWMMVDYVRTRFSRPSE